MFITCAGSAQIAPDKYFVQFTDKENSPYTISNPSEFLTQRALDRRYRFGIPISMNDIPVNTSYLQGVSDVGVEILNPSLTKLLNFDELLDLVLPILRVLLTYGNASIIDIRESLVVKIVTPFSQRDGFSISTPTSETPCK